MFRFQAVQAGTGMAIDILKSFIFLAEMLKDLDHDDMFEHVGKVSSMV